MSLHEYILNNFKNGCVAENQMKSGCVTFWLVEVKNVKKPKGFKKC